MPDPMQYSTQAIVYIADDLSGNAATLQLKRGLAGDVDEAPADAKSPPPRSKIFPAPLVNTLPADYRQATSRLIILGHGDQGSTRICTAVIGGHQYDAQHFARMVRGWLGGDGGGKPSRVKRISLHMCFGGGNRGGAVDSGNLRQFMSQYTVLPTKSFAHDFASRAGELAEEISARTDDTWMFRDTIDGVVVDAGRFVGQPGRHKERGDKFMFLPDPASTVDAPLKPAVRLPENRRG